MAPATWSRNITQNSFRFFFFLFPVVFGLYITIFQFRLRIGEKLRKYGLEMPGHSRVRGRNRVSFKVAATGSRTQERTRETIWEVIREAYNCFMSSRREEKATNVMKSGEFFCDLQRERDGRRGGTEECDKSDKEVEEDPKKKRRKE